MISVNDYQKISNFLKEQYNTRKYNRKINSFINHNPDLKTGAFDYKLVDKYWEQYGYRINAKWHQAYSSFNNSLDARYIPESIFYNFIEPKLNNMRLYLAYTDKNMYSNLLNNVNLPKTIIKNKNKMYYDSSDNKLSLTQVTNIINEFDGEFVIKPTLNTGGGKGVLVGNMYNGRIMLDMNATTFAEIEKMYKSDFIIQERLQQHDVLNNIYPYSLNTIRLVTLRVEDEIKITSVVARFGNNRSNVDNQASGGISCGVNQQGELKKIAIDKYARGFTEHPYTNVKLEGIKIPNYKSITSLVKMLHDQLSYFDMVSWDIAINKQGEPVLIEYNLSGQEINFHQFHNGPLFGEYTEFVLNKIKKK